MTKSKRIVKSIRPEQKLDINCKFFPTKFREAKDAPVMCTSTERLYTNKCEHCGWSPIVKAERLNKICGAAQAKNAVEYSLSITEGRNREYTKQWKDYKPKRGENDV